MGRIWKHNAPGPKRYVRFPDGEGDLEELLITRRAPRYYRLDETPFLSECASSGDTIEVDEEADGSLRFIRRVAPSGLRTYRCMVSKVFIVSPGWEWLKSRMLEEGGTWEQLCGGYLILQLPQDSPREFETEFRTAFSMSTET